MFAYHVKDPERYGVVELDATAVPDQRRGKAEGPELNYAVTGLYFYDNQVLDIAAELKPSPRGELEITDVNNVYLRRKQLRIELMSRGYAWLDTGTHQSLQQASNFIEILEQRQGSRSPARRRSLSAWGTSTRRRCGPSRRR